MKGGIVMKYIQYLFYIIITFSLINPIGSSSLYYMEKHSALRPICSSVVNKFLSNAICKAKNTTPDNSIHKNLQNVIDPFIESNQNFSVLLIDIDHFDAVNHNYGANTGNEIINYINVIIKDRIDKDKDVVMRYIGEDKYIIIFPDTDLHLIKDKARQLSAAIKESRICIFNVAGNNYIEVRVSMSIASFPKHGRTSNALLHKLYEAMNMAKKSGRDMIMICGECDKFLLNPVHKNLDDFVGEVETALLLKLYAELFNRNFPNNKADGEDNHARKLLKEAEALCDLCNSLLDCIKVKELKNKKLSSSAMPGDVMNFYTYQVANIEDKIAAVHAACLYIKLSMKHLNGNEESLKQIIDGCKQINRLMKQFKIYLAERLIQKEIKGLEHIARKTDNNRISPDDVMNKNAGNMSIDLGSSSATKDGETQNDYSVQLWNKIKEYLEEFKINNALLKDSCKKLENTDYCNYYLLEQRLNILLRRTDDIEKKFNLVKPSVGEILVNYGEYHLGISYAIRAICEPILTRIHSFENNEDLYNNCCHIIKICMSIINNTGSFMNSIRRDVPISADNSNKTYFVFPVEGELSDFRHTLGNKIASPALYVNLWAEENIDSLELKNLDNTFKTLTLFKEYLSSFEKIYYSKNEAYWVSNRIINFFGSYQDNGSFLNLLTNAYNSITKIERIIATLQRVDQDKLRNMKENLIQAILNSQKYLAYIKDLNNSLGDYEDKLIFKKLYNVIPDITPAVDSPYLLEPQNVYSFKLSDSRKIQKLIANNA